MEYAPDMGVYLSLKTSEKQIYKYNVSLESLKFVHDS